MSDENNTQLGGGEALPAAAPEVSKPAPRNDAEAAAQEAEAKAAVVEPAPTPDPEKEKKNRTRDYIDRINRERADLARKVAELEARTAQPTPQQRQVSAQPADGEPTLEAHDFDVAKFQRAHSAWAVEQALKQRDEDTQKAESTRKQQEIFTTYESRIVEFAEDHPDFSEVVGSIKYPLAQELQAAIMAHDKGPQIAYHLGTNDDDAFALASIQPHLAAAAVERLASRLTAAPTPAPTPAAPPIPAPVAPKPISQAPAPTPTVSGRSPTDTPPEKLTDDQWYAREREQSRKR